MSQKASDYSCVPLCADCHTQAPGAYHRAGKATFERRHRLSFADIVTRLNREWNSAQREGFARGQALKSNIRKTIAFMFAYC
jgi:hypothetical protein